MRALVILLVCSVTPFGVARADSAVAAHMLCGAINQTDMVTEPCRVSEYNKSIRVNMYTTSAEARKICYYIAEAAKQYNISFEKNWDVIILSPLSDTDVLARCGLS